MPPLLYSYSDAFLHGSLVESIFSWLFSLTVIPRPKPKLRASHRDEVPTPQPGSNCKLKLWVRTGISNLETFMKSSWGFAGVQERVHATVTELRLPHPIEYSVVIVLYSLCKKNVTLPKLCYSRLPPNTCPVSPMLRSYPYF